MTTMLSLLAFASLAHHQERTTIKETLPNEASVFVHRIEGARTFSIVLASVAGSDETPETHGIRHLVEHLAARGPERDVDRLLESVGIVLTAETTRDHVLFQITGTRDKVPVAVQALAKVASVASFEAQDAPREAQVIREELALRPWQLAMAADAWRKAYGEGCLDPFGDPAALSKLTPDRLSASLKSVFSAPSLCVAIVGDIQVEEAYRLAKGLLEGKGGSLAATYVRPQVGNPVLVGSAEGEGVGVPVPGLFEGQTMATLAAGFALQAWLPQVDVFYSPSPRPSVVTTTFGSGTSLSDARARLRGKVPAVANLGVRLLGQWASETASDPASLARLAAVCLPVYPSFGVESLTRSVQSVGATDVRQAVEAVLGAGQ